MDHDRSDQLLAAKLQSSRGPEQSTIDAAEDRSGELPRMTAGEDQTDQRPERSAIKAVG